MLKLPVCPYCKAVYHYKEVKILSRYEYLECRHCDKVFEVESKKNKIIYFSIVCVLLILLNLLLLQIINVYWCIGITAALLAVSLLLLPYIVKFKKDDSKRSSNKK